MALVGVPDDAKLTIMNSRLSDKNPEYTAHLYARLQRFGFLHRDAQRMVNQDRNVFSALVVARGDADGMVTGVTRSFNTTMGEVRRVIDPARGSRVIGASIILARAGDLYRRYEHHRNAGLRGSRANRGPGGARGAPFWR